MSEIKKLNLNFLTTKLEKFPLFDSFLDLADFLLVDFWDLNNFKLFSFFDFLLYFTPLSLYLLTSSLLLFFLDAGLLLLFLPKVGLLGDPVNFNIKANRATILLKL